MSTASKALTELKQMVQSECTLPVPQFKILCDQAGLSASRALHAVNGSMDDAASVQMAMLPISTFQVSGGPSGFSAEVSFWPDGLSGQRCFDATEVGEDPARAWFLAILSALILGEQP